MPNKIDVWLIPFCLIGGLALSTHTAAQTWDNSERVAAVYIKIDDQVTDGCWPRPKATEEAVELIFRQAEIPIAITSVDSYDLIWPSGYIPYFEDMAFDHEQHFTFDPHTFEISALGYNLLKGNIMKEHDINNLKLCVVHLNITLYRDEELHWWRPSSLWPEIIYLRPDARSKGKVVYGSSSVLLSGGIGFQGRITEWAKEIATSLANTILKAKLEAERELNKKKNEN